MLNWSGPRYPPSFGCKGRALRRRYLVSATLSSDRFRPVCPAEFFRVVKHRRDTVGVVIDLNDFSRQHLCYEAAMFAKARNKILSGAAPGFESNILIESCVLHLRNLTEFFYPKNVQPDDVVAAHYAPARDSKRPAI